MSAYIYQKLFIDIFLFWLVNLLNQQQKHKKTSPNDWKSFDRLPQLNLFELASRYLKAHETAILDRKFLSWLRNEMRFFTILAIAIKAN